MTITTKILPDGRLGLSLRDPAQIIASVPPLFGFRPADSLVLLGLGGTRGSEVCSAVRLAVPSAEHESEIVRQLPSAFTESGTRAIIVVLVGQGQVHPPGSTGPPYRRLVGLLRETFTAVGMEVLYALWTPEIREGAPWASYDDAAEGVLPDDAKTVTAAVFSAAGYVTFDSREDMASQLAPEDAAALLRREELLTAAIDAFDGSVDRAVVVRDGLALVRVTLDRIRGGDLSFSDSQVVELALALSEISVRHTCMALAFVPKMRRHAERLWLELIRRTPAPERAEPAVLLAYSAYQHGEGTLAGLALENALDANPGHLAAGLLSRCLARGRPPRRLRDLAYTEHLDALCAPVL
ncbi:DUF4192 domain-containing protein [Amycolatopsis pithecellobii]|uniref:DUF4192 domain-containing protein n=1 Tax=Amycolatopsis pithecellobii TaxID=664692 RepID=UPI001407C414|nr:DUF4192 domain-containing protein [Amycolatopsis pithecellobii]